MLASWTYLKKRLGSAAQGPDLTGAIALYRANELEAALIAFEEVLIKHPHCLNALLCAGTIHLEAARPEAAYFYFSRALRIDADNPVLLMHLSECQAAMGDLTTSDDTYERALDRWEPIAPPPIEVGAISELFTTPVPEAGPADWLGLLDEQEADASTWSWGAPSATGPLAIAGRARGTQPLDLDAIDVELRRTA